MNFDLDQLRIFDAIMTSRNFTVAGEKLGIGQSSISQQIKRLETQVGRKLFFRTTRRVELTPVGELFKIYAHSMLAIAEEVRRHFDETDVDGSIKIGVVEDFPAHKLHTIFSLFRQRFPRFALSITTGMSKVLFDKIDSGGLDIALGKRLPGRANGQLLCAEPLVWCGDVEIIGPDIQDIIPIVVYPEPCETRAAIVAAMKRTGRKFNIVAESENLVGIQVAVMSGFGLAAFSRDIVPPGVPVLPADLNIPALGDVEYIVDCAAQPRSGAVDLFVNLLTNFSQSPRPGQLQTQSMKPEMIVPSASVLP